MSEVLKWFEDNIYYSVNSGNATFSIQNEDLWEFEKLLKKQDRELQQKENIIKDIKAQLDYLETYSSKEDVFEDMKRRLDRIDKIIGSYKGINNE